MPDSPTNPEKRAPRFEQEQYERLLRCSEKKDMTEWNQWREENPDIEILLEGAELSYAHMERANLKFAHLEGTDLEEAHLERAVLSHAHLEGTVLEEAHLERAVLMGAHLEGTVLEKAHLERARLLGAHLEHANLYDSYLKRADLRTAHLEDAVLTGTHLESAVLIEAHMERAKLWQAHLEGAKLCQAHLEGAELERTHLEGCNFEAAIVDSQTFIWNCTIDDKTNFLGVGLNSARIHPGLKERLEGNIRKRRWVDWCRTHTVWGPLVRFFWWMSDYGRSTRRVIEVFCAFALGFAALYYALGAIDYYPHKNFAHPGVVRNLFTLDGANGGFTPVSDWIIPLRTIYFSVVTMTTLGFGDMYANPESYAGHVLLTVQVLLGYLLLGVLLTRLAVLFTAQGPADGGPPPEEPEEETGYFRRLIAWAGRLIRVRTGG